MATNDQKSVLFTINQSYIDKYGLNQKFLGKKIVIYNNRYTHIENHKLDFSSIQAYEDAVSNITSIIITPDFIAMDNKNNSLLFIKKLYDNTLVAARIAASSDLKVRTMYPITENKKNKLLLNSLPVKNLVKN